MSRVLFGLVALILVPSVVSAQATRTQTIAIQAPDGSVTVRTQGVAGQAPARDLPPQRTGTSRIRGRVLAADTGQPARRATMNLTGGDLRQPRSTVTDPDGRYEFRDLPSGRYFLSANKNTYVTISYGQTRPMEPGRPIEVGENQIVDKIDFNLPRGGVIAGRILDEYGEPIANAMVQPMQNRFVNGQQRPMPSGSTFSTSDTGEYRLWGLAPGQYFVSVTARSGMGTFAENTDDRSGYPSTYFPGTASLAEAQPVTVATGQTTSGIDIMLMPTRTAQVSGTAIDSKGQPVTRGMVMAMQRSATGMFGGSQGGQIRPDGTFTIPGLTPGEYMLRGNVPPRPGETQPETLVAAVTVAGGDITGILLTPLQPAVVKGRIIFDPSAPSLQPSMVRVTAMPKNTEPMLLPVPTGPPQTNDDFTFELKSSPGQMVIRAMVMPAASNAANTWVVKSVRHDTTDITDVGIDFVAGREIDGIEIVLTNRVQVISGSVTDSRGDMAKNATVALFAQDRERWGGPTRYVAVARLDQAGRYSSRTLPPGDYYAVALDNPDQPRLSGRDPEYLEQLISNAVRFTLREAETVELGLKLAVLR